MPEEDFGA